MMRMKEGDVCYPLLSSLIPISNLNPANHSSTLQEQHLLLAKKEIEDAYNTGFWANVAANMERRGADKYPSAFLQKTFKELESAGKTTINGVATNGAKDDDAVKEEDTGDGDAA